MAAAFGAAALIPAALQVNFLDQQTTFADALWRMAFAVAFSITLIDWILVRHLPDVTVSRHMRPNIPLNRAARVELRIDHGFTGRIVAQLYDHFPANVACSDMPITVALHPGERTIVDYHVRPTRRGDLRFGETDLLLPSPLGLWERRRSVGQETEIRVYPDFSAIARYLEMVSDQHVSRLGIKLHQRRGEGLEFHQLREYRAGDSLRQIDWKATSRRRELISKEYQEERDQQILFAMDSGLRMRSQDGELSHFDHALNAMLLLAYVALRQGDAVGMLSFGAREHWVPMLRGVNSINTLLNEVYDLHSGPQAGDYVALAEEIMRRQRRRALVVLMTNLRSEDQDLLPALKLIRQRHVVLLANLRESVLDEAIDMEPLTFEESLTLAGTVHYVRKRRQIQRQYERESHLTIDTRASELPIKVVNSYWQVKRAGIL
jgi:uncharacterized protein (DUF58 family)